MTWHLTKTLTLEENSQIPTVCKGSPCQNGGHCDLANDLQACFSLKISVFFCKTHFHSVRMKIVVKHHEPLKVFHMYLSSGFRGLLL